MRIIHIKESFNPSSDGSWVSLAIEQKAAGDDVFILASVEAEKLEYRGEKVILHSKEDNEFERTSALKLLRIQHNKRSDGRIPRKDLRNVLIAPPINS